MSFAKGSALVLGFVAAVGLGVWIGPHITHRGAAVVDATASSQSPVGSFDKELTARTVTRMPASDRGTAKQRKAAETTAARRSVGATPRAISVIALALHERLKPLLNKGANMDLASEDFGDAEQFAAVAHAARNTEIPFMALKHRVVYEAQSLTAAIQELKPDLNGAVEAQRAYMQAKSDISALEG
jgi:hypothetical protein